MAQEEPKERRVDRQDHRHSGMDTIGLEDANIDAAAFRMRLKRKLKAISKPSYMFRYIDLIAHGPSDRKSRPRLTYALAF